MPTVHYHPRQFFQERGAVLPLFQGIVASEGLRGGDGAPRLEKSNDKPIVEKDVLPSKESAVSTYIANNTNDRHIKPSLPRTVGKMKATTTTSTTNLKPLFNKGDEVHAAWWDPSLDMNQPSGKNASWYPGSILSYKTIGKNMYGPLRLYHIKYEDGDELKSLEDCWIFTKTDYELTMKLDEEEGGCGWTNVGITKRYDTKSTDMWASKVGWYEWVGADGEVQSFSFLSDAMKAHDGAVAAREEELEEGSVLQITNEEKGGNASDLESDVSSYFSNNQYCMQALAEAKRAYAAMESLIRVRKKPQPRDPRDIMGDDIIANELSDGDAQKNDVQNEPAYEFSSATETSVTSPKEVETETCTAKEMQQNQRETEQTGVRDEVHQHEAGEFRGPYARQVTTSLRNLNNDDNPTPEHKSHTPRGATPKVLLERQRTQDKDMHMDTILNAEGTVEALEASSPPLLEHEECIDNEEHDTASLSIAVSISEDAPIEQQKQSNSRNITPDADGEKPPLSDREVHDPALETADDPLDVSSPDRNVDGRSAAKPANNKDNVDAEEGTAAANPLPISDKAVTSINQTKWEANIEGMLFLSLNIFLHDTSYNNSLTCFPISIALKEYKRIHGHVNVPARIRPLGTFVSNQRQYYRKGSHFMTKERIEELESVSITKICVISCVDIIHLNL